MLPECNIHFGEGPQFSPGPRRYRFILSARDKGLPNITLVNDPWGRVSLGS